MSKLSKNILYNLFGQGLLLVLGFVAVKYVFRQLGEDALGIIYFTLSLNAVLCAALEMGLCTTTVREVSSCHRDRPAYIQELLQTASALYWGVYLLLAAGIYFAVPFLVQHWIILKTVDPVTAIRGLRILAMAGLLTLPNRLYASVFQGIERMTFNNALDVGNWALQQFGTVAILLLGGGLLRVIWWMAMCFVFTSVAYMFTVTRFFPWRVLVPKYSSAVVRQNRGFSLHTAGISLLGVAQTQADKMILSKLLPIGVLGYYGMAYTLTARASLVTGAIAPAALPSFSGLFAAGEENALLRSYRKLQDLVCLISVPIFAGILFFSVPLFTSIFNGPTANLLLWPTVFLCLGFYMHAALYMPYIFSLAVGKPEISNKANFFALIFLLPVTAFLIYFYGLTGAGFSWVVYHLFVFAYTVPRLCRECLRIPVRDWFTHLGRILMLGAVTYGAAWMFVSLLSLHSVSGLALAYLFATTAFMLGTYGVMSSELRAALYSLSRHLMIKTAQLVRL
jgi:O-antigen/teichoic acid export membrane protein